MKLPTLRRRPAAEQPTGNPATLAADLREQIAHSAQLAAQLVLANQRADVAERRAETAEAEHERIATALLAAHAALVNENRTLKDENEKLRKDRDSVRSQLDHALGYGAAELRAIETGSGQPRATVDAT